MKIQQKIHVYMGSDWPVDPAYLLYVQHEIPPTYML